MPQHSRSGHRRRKFRLSSAPLGFFVAAVLLTMVVVALLIFYLSDSRFIPRG